MSKNINILHILETKKPKKKGQALNFESRVSAFLFKSYLFNLAFICLFNI